MDIQSFYLPLLNLLPMMLAPLFILGWGISYFFFLPISERNVQLNHWVKRLHQTYFGLGIFCYSVSFVLEFSGIAKVVSLHPVLKLFSENLVFPLDFLYDNTSLLFLLLGQVLCAIVGKFSYNYLYLEKRKSKFFFYLFFFLLGYQIVIPAQNFNLIMLGWEVLGLSSVLLVGFFNDRHRPLESSLKVFFIYRMADLLLLVALILLHQKTLQTGISSISLVDYPIQQLLLCLIVVVGLIKASLFPLRSWLPMAMEGPTPSSAIFYGGLSVHVGIVLLMKIEPLMMKPDFYWFRMAFCFYLSIVFLRSTFLLRKISDYKSIQSYKTLQHLALIAIEIMLGYVEIALVYTFLHAIYRTFQFLQAPQQFLDFIHSKRQDGPVEMKPHLFWILFEACSNKMERFYILISRKALVFLTEKKINVFGAVVAAFIIGWRVNSFASVGYDFVVQNLDLISWLGMFFVLSSLFKQGAKEKIAFLWLGQCCYWFTLGMLKSGQMGELLLMSLGAIFLLYGALYLIYDLSMPRYYRANLLSYHGVSHYFAVLAHWHFFFVLCLMGFPISHLFFGQEVILEDFLHADPLGLALPFALGGLITGYQLLLIHLRFFYGPANPVFQLATIKKWNLRGIYAAALILVSLMINVIAH